MSDGSIYPAAVPPAKAASMAVSYTQRTKDQLERSHPADSVSAGAEPGPRIPGMTGPVWCIVFSVVIVVIVALTHPTGLTFHGDIMGKVVATLGALLLVSIFIERIIEVVVSLWASPEADLHEQQIDYWRARVARLSADIEKCAAEMAQSEDPARKELLRNWINAANDQIREASEAVDVHEKALIPCRAATRKLATWLGVAVGIFAASIGFRLFHQIVGVPEPGAQRNWFFVGDTVLSGFVLGGGSKLIHRVFAVYTAFMESSQRALKNQEKIKAGG